MPPLSLQSLQSTTTATPPTQFSTSRIVVRKMFMTLLAYLIPPPSLSCSFAGWHHGETSEIEREASFHNHISIGGFSSRKISPTFVRWEGSVLAGANGLEQLVGAANESAGKGSAERM